jgi:murein L,D-transpeptidase YcbB/YkuD
MTQEEQTTAFETELERLISRFRSEFGLTLASVIGVLELAKLNIYKEQQDNDDG